MKMQKKRKGFGSRFSLRELADLLGVTVGASCAAVDAGWIPTHLQRGRLRHCGGSLPDRPGPDGAVQKEAEVKGRARNGPA